MSIDKHIKEKKCIKYTYHMFKEKNKIDFDKESNEIYLNEKKNIFKLKPFKLSIALTILLLVLTLSIIEVNKNINEKKFEEDVKNIIELCDNTGKGDKPEARHYFDWFLDSSYKKYATLYSIEINLDDYYVMCGYRIQEYPFLVKKFRRNTVDWTEVTWVKYKKDDIIKEEIDGKYLFVIYNVYDILVKEDLLNNKKHNIVCKYYQWTESYWRFEDNIANLKKEMILWHYTDIEENKLSDYYLTGSYEAIYDENNSLNIVFIKKITYSDGTTRFPLEDQLDIWYSRIMEKCNQNEIMYEEAFIGGYKRSYEKVMISINDLKQILLEGE